VSLLGHLSRLGIGVSSFASVGDKYDVSSNDLLMWWEQDGQTRLAVLYVESFGSPRKFARTARRVGQRMPVLTVLGGRSAAGQRAAAAHVAAAGAPLVTQQALFEQAGIIAVPGLGELVEAAAVLACQPLPAGDRVAIVSNAGGAGVLAADACVDNGLRVAVLSAATQARLGTLLPPGAAVAGPVDTTAAVGHAAFRACLEEVAADDDVNALLVVTAPTAITDLTQAVATARVCKPLVTAVLDQPETVRLVPAVCAGAPDADRPAAVPVYAYPEGAARALGHAAAYHAWRGRQRGQIPGLDGLRTADARAHIAAFLVASPEGGWLPAAAVRDLLACYEIPLTPGGQTTGEIEVRAGVVQEPVFGPLVVFGPGGASAGLAGDQAARLTPLTDTDARDLIQSVRAAPLLLGHGDTPPVDTAALAGLLLRVSRLADDLPEVAELDLSPVVAGPKSVRPVAARIRVSPAQPADPFLRRLR
jgi:acyl-CoA synthetase (NDP forming)